METNDLKKYLKEIITLESAAFEYSQYIAVAEKNAIYRGPKKNEYEKPKLLQYEYEPSKETEVITSELIGDFFAVPGIKLTEIGPRRKVTCTECSKRLYGAKCIIETVKQKPNHR